MKILFVTNHYLDNVNSGGAKASLAFIRAFSDISSEICLIYPQNNNDIVFLNDKLIKVGVLGTQNVIIKFINLLFGKINRFSKVFFQTFNNYNPDLVVFDNSRSSYNYIQFVKSKGKKIVTIHHNFENEYYLTSKDNFIVKKLLSYHMFRAESIAVRLSDLSLTLTNEDIIQLKQYLGKKEVIKIERIGIFEPLEIKLPSTKLVSFTPVFLISGNLSAAQTEISLVDFVNNYFSILTEIFKGSKLIIVGRSPSKKIIQLCGKFENIELIPDPISMNLILSKGDVYLCPISCGGGIKLRVMDGLKFGMPVVSHLVSSRGYDTFKKHNILTDYSNPQTFRNTLLELRSEISRDRLQTRAQRVQELYIEQFSFSNGFVRLHEILKRNNIIK